MVKLLSLSLTIYNDAHFDFSLVVSRLDTKPRRGKKKRKCNMKRKKEKKMHD